MPELVKIGDVAAFLYLYPDDWLVQANVPGELEIYDHLGNRRATIFLSGAVSRNTDLDIE